MLKQIILSVSLAILSFSCLAQYNVDFANLNQVEVLSEVEACNQEVALYVGWQPDAYGSDNGRLIFGRYFIASGAVINSNVYPATGSFSFSAQEIDIEATAIKSNPTGDCTGYAIAVSLSRNGLAAETRLLILDALANVTTQTITSASVTQQGQVHGLFQDSAGDLVMCGSIYTQNQPTLPLVQKYSSINGLLLDSRTINFDANGDGVPDGIEARDILELSGSNSNAKYAVVCNSTQNSYIIGLTDNLTPAGSYIYDVDGRSNPEIPIAMAEKDGYLYVVGDDLANKRVTLVAVSAQQSNSEALFSERFTETISARGSQFRVTDIVASPNEGVILSGYDFNGIFNTAVPFESLLVHIGATGSIEQVTSHNGAYNSALLYDIDRIPGTSGLIAAGASLDKNLPGSWSMKLLNVDRTCSEPCVKPAYLRAKQVVSNSLNTRIGIGDTPNRAIREPMRGLSVNVVQISNCSRPPSCDDVPPICRTDQINISTGYDENIGQNIGIGQPDDDWVLTSSSSLSGSNFPLSAFVKPEYQYWHGSYPANSGWISINATQNFPGSSEHAFERCFCVCEEDSVFFDFQTTVDDQLVLNLNKDGAFFDHIQTINSNGAVHQMWDVHYDNLLSAGKYCLEAQVRNVAGPMGFLANGTISSESLVTDGCCSPVDSFLITGIKFDDLNCNQERDGDGREPEPGVEGCTVSITTQSGVTVWTGTTDANGFFSASVPAGTYDVSVAPVAPAVIHVPTSGTETVTVGPDAETAYVVFGQKDPTDCNCLDVSVTPLAVGQVSGDTCCYTFFLDNDFGNYYDEVVLTTASGSFFAGNSGDDYNWTIEGNGSSVSVTPELQPTLGELIEVIVCLEGIGTSSEITIDWQKDEQSICEDTEIVNCGCGIESIGTITPASGDECCVASVNIQNDFTQGLISKVELEIVEPSSSTTTFDESTYDLGQGVAITSSTTTSITLETIDGTPFPTGDLSNVLSFCFADGIQPSYEQHIQVTYFNEKCNPIIGCTDTLIFTCEPIVQSDCLEATFISAECNFENDQLQVVTLDIANFSDETISQIIIFSNTAPVFPQLTPVSIPATPPGSSATVSFTISTAGLVLPQTLTLYIGMHGVQIGPVPCCTREVEIEIAPCCEPCESDWLSVETQIQDSCCTEISIINDCEDQLQKVTATILTAGSFIKSIALNPDYTNDWTVGMASGTDYIEADFIASDYAEIGTYENLFSFCLSDTIGNPVELVEINYVGYSAQGRDSILCSDTIQVFCDREPECLEILRDSVYCDSNGNYFLDVVYKSNTYPAFTADNLMLTVEPAGTTPGLFLFPTINTGIGLSPGGNHSETYQIYGFPQAGDQLVISSALHSVTPSGTQDTCCFDDEIIALTLPDCGSDNCCRDYNAFLIDVINYQGPNSSCDTAFAQAPHLDSCQFTTIDWGDGTTTTSQGPFAVQHTYSQIGTYIVCTRFSESFDGGFTSCWDQERCDTVVIDTCSRVSPVPLCDTLSEAMTQYFGWAAVTCSAYDDFDDQTAYNGNDYVLGLIDIRNHEGAPVGSNWSPPMYHGPASQKWTGNELGDIFGLALDPQGNIYTSFYGLYSRDPLTSSQQHFGSPSLNPLQKPTIYWVNPVTGVIENVGESLAIYQSVGPEGIYLGFGNLAFNPLNEHLWVTNISNGKIYALDRNPISPTFGDAIYSFAPPLSTTFGTDPGRVFGLGYNHVEHRLYYSVWRDNSPGLGAGVNEVFSVKLNSAGGIAGPAVSEWQATSLAPNYPFSNPVLDISFSSDGSQMLLSERSIISEPSNKLASYSHESRHLRLSTANPDAASTNWILDTSDPYASEHTLGANSAGGGDFTYDSPKFDSCDAIVVLSEDIIKPDPNSNLLAYGIRGVDVEGGTIADNWFVDLDGITDQSDKYEIGDVEAFRELCCTSRPVERCALNASEWDVLVDAIEVEEWPNAMFRISNLLDRRNSRYIITPAQYWLTVDWGDGTVDRDIAGRDFPVDHIYASNGSFRIRLLHELIGTDGVQCFETIEDFSVTDVEEADLSTAIQVMPNPFTSELRVSAIGLGANIEEVSLYNMTGQQVQVYKIDGQRDQHTLDTQALAPGMYVVRARLSNGSIASSMVVHLE